MRSSYRTLPSVLMTLVLSVTLASSLLAQTPAAATPKGTVERVKVHGKSLEGNLEGDSPDRDPPAGLPAGQAHPAGAQNSVVVRSRRWLPV